MGSFAYFGHPISINFPCAFAAASVSMTVQGTMHRAPPPMAGKSSTRLNKWAGFLRGSKSGSLVFAFRFLGLFSSSKMWEV